MRAYLISLGALAMVVSVAPMRAADTPDPTFYRDVLPVLQKNCQSCHRPGEVAPMSLVSYEDARPWARAIKSQDDGEADAAVVRRS